MLTNSTDVCYMTCSHWIFILENVSSGLALYQMTENIKDQNMNTSTFKSFSCWLKPIWKNLGKITIFMLK